MVHALMWRKQHRDDAAVKASSDDDVKAWKREEAWRREEALKEGIHVACVRVPRQGDVEAEDSQGREQSKASERSREVA